MNKYVIGKSTVYTLNDELMHYGVPGMKWGVRKEEYKAMDRHQRKKTRDEYYQTPAGKQRKVTRNTMIGTLLGGPLVGVAAGLITAKRNGELQKRVSQGKDYVEKLATKRTVEFNSPFGEHTRVTGQQEADFWREYAKILEREQNN